MPIKFYYMPESPACRAVEMVARMVGVELDKCYIDLFRGEHLKGDYVDINPARKIPYITDGDLSMGESRAIMAYLVNRYKPNHPHLYPQDPISRARIDELLYYEASTLFPAMSRLLFPKVRGPVAELDQDDQKAFERCLAYLDRRLGRNKAKRFMLSHHVSIADVSIAASFSFAEACRYDLHNYKQIVAYLNRIRAAIPDYDEINDGPVENMMKFIDSNQKQDKQT